MSSNKILKKTAKLILKGKIEEAIKELEEYVEKHPEDEEAIISLTKYLKELGRYKEAKEILEKATKTIKSPKIAYELIHLLADRMNQPKKALEIAEQALKEFKDNPLIISAYAMTLNMLERKKEALKTLDEALKKNPENPHLLEAKAWIIYKEKPEEAEAILRRIPNIQNNVDLRYLLACIKYIKGEFKEAEKIVRENIKMVPIHVPSYELLYRICIDSIRDKEALKIAEKLLRINTTNPDFWFMKGNALFGMQKFEEALRCCERALELDPTHVDSLELKAWILEQFGRFDEALKCYEKILEQNPNNPSILIQIASVFIMKREFDKAEEYLRKAEQLGGTSLAIYWLCKGDLLRALERFDEAIKCYEMAAKVDKTLVVQEAARRAIELAKKRIKY